MWQLKNIYVNGSLVGQGALRLKKYRNNFRTVSKKRNFWCNDTLMIFFLINGGFFKTKCWKQQTPYDHCQYMYDRAPDITEAWQRHLTGAIAILHFIPAAALSQVWPNRGCGVSERHALPTYLSCRFRMNEINYTFSITVFSNSELFFNFSAAYQFNFLDHSFAIRQ